MTSSSDPADSKDEKPSKIATRRHVALALAAVIMLWGWELFFVPLLTGLTLVHDANLSRGGAPSPFTGWLFVAGALLVGLIHWTLAGLVATAGFHPLSRTTQTIALILAGIECFFFPIGPVLGLVTIVFLKNGPIKILGPLFYRTYYRNKWKRRKTPPGKAGG